MKKRNFHKLEETGYFITMLLVSIVIPLLLMTTLAKIIMLFNK